MCLKLYSITPNNICLKLYSITVNPQKAMVRVFEYILEKGPVTAYQITNEGKLNIEQGNIIRILKRLESTDSVSKTPEQKGRQKKYYAPTIIGLIGACVEHPKFLKKLPDYYDRWSEHKQFVNSLRLFFRNFDNKTQSQQKKILKEYIEYARTCMNTFNENKNKMPIGFQLVVGELLNGYLRPEKAKKDAANFFENVSSYRQNIKNFMLGQEKLHGMLQDETGEISKKLALILDKARDEDPPIDSP